MRDEDESISILADRIHDLRISLYSAWRNLRYREYRNNTVEVGPIAAAPTGRDDTRNIQQAINHIAGTDTLEYQIYLDAKVAYEAKWYRWFIRKPIWIVGGVVSLTSGTYAIGSTINVKSNQTIQGAGIDKTTLKDNNNE